MTAGFVCAYWLKRKARSQSKRSRARLERDQLQAEGHRRSCRAQPAVPRNWILWKLGLVGGSASWVDHAVPLDWFGQRSNCCAILCSAWSTPYSRVSLCSCGKCRPASYEPKRSTTTSDCPDEGAIIVWTNNTSWNFSHGSSADPRQFGADEMVTRE